MVGMNVVVRCCGVVVRCGGAVCWCDVVSAVSCYMTSTSVCDAQGHCLKINHVPLTH